MKAKDLKLDLDGCLERSGAVFKFHDVKHIREWYHGMDFVQEER